MDHLFNSVFRNLRPCLFACIAAAGIGHSSALPVISVGDAAWREPVPSDQSTTSVLAFPITLSEPAGPETMLEYTFHRGSRDYPALPGAAYGYDYDSGVVRSGGTLLREGLISIAPGATSVSLTFSIYADLHTEGDEAVELRLSARNATLARSHASGIISDGVTDPWVIIPFRTSSTVVRVEIHQKSNHGQGTLLGAMRLVDNGTLGSGAITVAAADMTGDGLPEIILGSSGGVRSKYYILSGSKILWANGPGPQDASVLGEFNPSGDSTWPVYVAAADMTGDGRAEIITGEGAGSAGRVVAWNIPAYWAGAFPIPRVYDHSPYENGFTGGTRVAAADITGDGRAEVIMGSGPGRYSFVRTVNATAPGGPVDLQGFFPFASDFLGGVYVAAGDWDGDGRAEVLVGAGEGGGPHLRVYQHSSGNFIDGFFMGNGGNVGLRPAMPLSFFGGSRTLFGFTPGDRVLWLKDGAGGIVNWSGLNFDCFIAAVNPPAEPVRAVMPPLVKPALTISATAAPFQSTVIKFPAVYPFFYDLESSPDLGSWRYESSTYSGSPEGMFEQAIENSARFYRVKAVRLEE